MRGEDFLPPPGADLGDGCGALDPVAELAEVFVEENEHRDRLELPLVQIALHDVVVLVAEEDPHVELSALLREAPQHWKLRDHVAAPILGEDDDLHRARQRAERGDILFGEVQTLLVLLKALAVPRHLRLEGLVGQSLVEAGAIDRHEHGLLRCSHHGTTERNAPSGVKIPASGSFSPSLPCVPRQPCRASRALVRSAAWLPWSRPSRSASGSPSLRRSAPRCPPTAPVASNSPGCGRIGARACLSRRSVALGHLPSRPRASRV